MEPFDGLNRVSKDRWKILCSICGIPYGACIQCSNNACYIAYHPLCVRAAGFCNEVTLPTSGQKAGDENKTAPGVSKKKRKTTVFVSSDVVQNLAKGKFKSQ